MPHKSQLKSFPDRKISETFLHFAEPLLEALGPSATDDQMEQSLKIAFTVWNAVVYETVNGDKRFLDMAHELTAHEPAMAGLVDFLVARKRRVFGDDHRLIGEYKFVFKDGERRLRVEARDPSSPLKYP
jgi:hypothetical protein